MSGPSVPLGLTPGQTRDPRWSYASEATSSAARGGSVPPGRAPHSEGVRVDTVFGWPIPRGAGTLDRGTGPGRLEVPGTGLSACVPYEGAHVSREQFPIEDRGGS
ncbi:hypothetical protein XF36_02350 [Pseudonocardia sp. HH130629-09]|nr:hypothetical protein XF36_02350 [Pseudonocardia sp. HH130629-09]